MILIDLVDNYIKPLKSPNSTPHCTKLSTEYVSQQKTIKIGLSYSGIGAHCRCIIDSYMQALWHCPPYVLEQDTLRLIKIGQTLCCLLPLCVPG